MPPIKHVPVNLQVAFRIAEQSSPSVAKAKEAVNMAYESTLQGIPRTTPDSIPILCLLSFLKAPATSMNLRMYTLTIWYYFEYVLFVRPK